MSISKKSLRIPAFIIALFVPLLIGNVAIGVQAAYCDKKRSVIMIQADHLL